MKEPDLKHGSVVLLLAAPRRAGALFGAAAVVAFGGGEADAFQRLVADAERWGLKISGNRK